MTSAWMSRPYTCPALRSPEHKTLAQEDTMPSQAVPMTNLWALLNITPALSYTSKAALLKSAEQIQCTY